MKRFPIAFVPRGDALSPLAVVGIGPVARALAERMLRYTDDELHRLRGVVGDEMLLALGPGEILPWVDGVTYLGQDPGAPRLLVPTVLRPDIAIDLFEKAIVARASDSRPPLAVVTSPPRVLSVADALPIARNRLRVWLEARP